jgi:predicted DNA-binding transcriptional regulator AlpA
MAKQRWFRPADLARRWRVHRITIWRWTEKGKLPEPHRFSKRVVAWPRSVVLAFERRAA